MGEENRRERLLLVDDEEDFLRSSARALNRRGIDVQTARDGPTALSLVAEGEFDVVVLDLKMPGMDGEEVFDRLREVKPDLPVIMLTGHGSIPHAFKTSKKGIADYIAKPCDIDELAERVHKAAAKAKQPSAESGREEHATRPDACVEVLLVDDEEAFLSSMKTVLQRRGMKVSCAGSAAEALDRLKEVPIEVAVVDVKMAGMDGLELLKRVRADFPSVKVILLSGHPSASAALEGIRLGASEYLLKPPDVDSLADQIHHLSRLREEDMAAQRKKLLEEILERYPD